MITLTTEQAQQIEEALKLAIRTSYSEHNNIKFEASLATIRAARAQEQAEQEPVAEVIVRPLRGDQSQLTTDIKWLQKPTTGKLYAAPVEPVEQEPVAWIEIERGIPMFVRFADKYKPNCDGFIPLYDAPVRTKDLTDDEIEAIMVEQGDLRTTAFARAVIAADREKNK